MAIKEYIYLLGVEDVQASLKRLADEGEQALGQFRELGGAGAAEPFAPITESSKAAADATKQLTLRSHDLRGIMYVLRPVLQAAGIEVGQLGMLARLAGVGIAGIAAAAAGAVVVGLARLEDAARTTKGELEDLFQSKALSEKAFAGIQASALQFNTTVANIVPGVEALKVAWDRFITETRTFKFVAPAGGDIGQIIPPGMIGSIESLQTAYNNFLKLLRAGRLDQTNATKAAQTFFTAMQNGGKVTAEMLRSLPVGTVNQIAQAMGRGTISTQQFINEVKLSPIAMDKLLEALNRFSLESDAAFRANAIITYKDKLGEIFNTLSEGFKTLTGVKFSDFVVAELERVNQGIKDTIKEWEKLVALIKWIEEHTQVPFIGPMVQKTREGAAAVGLPGTGIAPSEATTEENNRAWEAAGISAKERFIKGFRDAPKAAEDVGQTITRELDSFAERWQGDIKKGLEITGPRGILPSWEELKRIWDSLNLNPNQFGGAGGVPMLAATPALLALSWIQAPQAAEQQQAQTQPIVAPFQAADQQIRTIWQALVEYITTSISSIDFSPITQALVQPFTDALPAIRDVLLQVEQMIREIIRQAQEAQRAVQGIGAGRPFSSPGFIEVAGGGYIRGPGSTTSDSILAWLSNREFVVNAKAVDHYGADFFAALNAMRLPKDLFGHFAIGGLARALTHSMSGFKTGGVATANATRSLTLVLDTRKFNVTGSKATIDELEREAVMRGISATGIAPGWVR